jgi:preprotein translocase subunit SecY
MTAGSLFTLWLAEEITERGLGNGQSMIILAGIVARLPALAAETLRRAGEGKPLLLALFSLAAIVGTVFVTRAERRIPLRHAKEIRGRGILSGGRNYLPLRVNSAGVMPIIFASSAFVLPQVLGFLPGLQWIRALFERLGFLFTLVYTAAVFFFSYFWTYLFYSPSEIALQLQEAGSFVPGLRPGPTTARFLNVILARLTLSGAAFLAALALLPGLLIRALGGDVLWESFLGGSSLLIVVGVGLDLAQKLDSYLQMHRYGSFQRPSKS